MKINKNLLICALLVLVMLCVVSTASAAEESLDQNLTISDVDEVNIDEPISTSESEDVLSVDDEQPLTASDNKEVLSAEHTVNNYDELKAAVTSASDGDIIILNDGIYEFPSSGGSISLDKSLTFKGQTKTGVTITSLGTYSIFSGTDAYNLKIQNINFEGVATSGSGIVAIGGSGKLDVVDCSFNNCKAKAGAIRFFGTGDCIINGLIIKNHELSYSSASSYATALTLSGNAKYNLQKIIIENVNYTYSSSYARGVIYISNNAATAAIDDLTIINCGGNMQGIINNGAKTTITNSVISQNNIPGATGNAIIRNSNSLTIEQSIINDNTVTNPNGGYVFQDAGSSSLKTTLILKNNNIYDNTVPTKIYYTTNTQYVDSVSAETNYWGDNYETTSDVSTATGITQSTWANKNGDTFINQPSGEVNDKIPTPSTTPAADDIYVSSTGDDAKDGSTPDNAVQSIKHAIELAANGGNIYVVAGDYTIDETLVISKDLTIKCESGLATIKGTASKIFDNSASLSFENIKFTFTGNGAIINNNAGTLTVEKCTFEVDGVDASAINVDGGIVNIENSVLLNPTGYALTVSSTPSTVTANNNWWGKNDAANTNATVSSWIVMDAGIDLERINPNDEITITTTFTKTNDGNDYTGNLPEFNVTFTAANLNENVSIKNNQASVKYTVNADDEVTVTSGSESIKIPLKLYDAPEIIYVNATGGLDTNDGDEAHPVQSIAKAIELAVKGKIILLEGTHTIDNTLTVSKDLDIKGEGTVIVDGNSKRILNNNANLNITNVRFTNGFDSSAVIVNNANMTLSNTLFYSNVNLNGYVASVVRNNKKLLIDNSKFYENKERYGNIYNNGGELFINNTEFYDNDMTAVTTVNSGLAVYSEGGNAVIENSKFYNNKGNFSIIYFMSKDSLSSTKINNLTIDNCIFDNNQLVRYGAIHSQKANTTIKDSTFTNNVVIKGTSSDANGAAIYVYGEKVTVETSVFKNNNADKGNDIYVYSGELDISDSVLININGYSIEKESVATIIANDNWWGANTPIAQFDVERWIIMTVTSNDTEIETDDVITITASFDKTNSSEGVIADYAGDLPEVLTVTFTSTSGNLNEVKTVKDKKAEVTYTVVEADKKITVISDIAQGTLNIHRILDTVYVSENGDNENDGDFNTPVKTLKKAVELAVKGKIVILNGTYKTDDLGIISHDLNITGEGKVIIDADNSNRILYVFNDSNVVLKNLVMINGFQSEASDESGALIGSAGNLTIINCTLANSISEKNGGAIYNAGNLVVIDSIFENNTADKCGGAIFTQAAGIGITPSLTVTNSEFYNNSASGNSKYAGGAIFVQGASSASISDSIFIDNQAIDYGGGAVEIVVTETATIDNTLFIRNIANGEDYKDKSDYGGGAISFIGSYGDLKETLKVTNSLFLNNSVSSNGGGAIYTRYAKVDVANSVLIGNDDAGDVSIYRRSTDVNTAKVTANDNWWGSNDNPKSKINAGTLTRWAVLTITNDSEIKTGETVKVTVSVNNYTTGTETGALANPIKVLIPVTIHTNLGNMKATLVNGENTTDYIVPEGLKIISATVDSETQVLYVLTTQTNVKLENITAMMGDKVTYTINVTSNDGSIVNTGNIELYFANDLIATIPVINGQAKDTVFIKKVTGNHTITAKYIDETKEFANNESTATLKVTGIDNVVTPETFNSFFDEYGYLKEDFILDEIIFKGEFKDMGIISIDKPVKVTGDNAIFNNTALSIECDDVCVNNINFVADKQFTENDDALIYIGGDNTVLTNNNITYNAPDDVESHVIEIDYANNVKITDNNIKYSAKSNGTVETIAVTGYEANSLVFENNKLDAEIPSVDNYKSKGVNIESSNNVTFNKNTIDVKCSHVNGTFDTVVGVDFEECHDSRVTDNTIDVTGNGYAYALMTNFCENITISGNDIKSTGNNYANGVQVGGDSTGVVDNNNISAKATNVTYPVYFDDYGSDSEVNLTNNNVTGESDTVYGVYVEENKTLISNNNISVNGNHVYGVITHQTDVVIDGNDIEANGKDTGSIVSPQSGVNENTTGIIVSEGSAKITNNNVVTTGQSAIAAVNTNADIVKNGLTANGTTANETIKNVNSNVISANNTAAKNATSGNDTQGNNTPDNATAVVKIIAASNAKVDYGFKYTVRVTEDGKSIGAGKKVTLKIAGKTLSALTNANGYAAFTLAVKPKAYNVIIAYDKVTQKAKVTVKNVIKAKNLKIKKSAKKVKIKVTLKTSAKKPIKGKKVTLKIKGKKITAKTNKKGVATFKVKKSILKKLKAGKKYKYQVIYGKDTVKKTLKVKR